MMFKMAHVNRIVMIVVLVIAIVVCGLVIRKMDGDLQQNSITLAALESKVTTLESMMQDTQTATTQEIDALNADVATLEVLVNDLGLQVAN